MLMVVGVRVPIPLATSPLRLTPLRTIGCRVRCRTWPQRPRVGVILETCASGVGRPGSRCSTTVFPRLGGVPVVWVPMPPLVVRGSICGLCYTGWWNNRHPAGGGSPVPCKVLGIGLAYLPSVCSNEVGVEPVPRSNRPEAGLPRAHRRILPPRRGRALLWPPARLRWIGVLAPRLLPRRRLCCSCGSS